jgi:cell division protein FtsB
MQCIAIDKDPEAVREIAREYYYMKNSGEDVFMIKDEKGEEDE